MFVLEFVLHAFCEIKKLIPGIFQAWEQLLLFLKHKEWIPISNYHFIPYYSRVREEAGSFWFKWQFFCQQVMIRFYFWCNDENCELLPPLVSGHRPDELLFQLMSVYWLFLFFVDYYFHPSSFSYLIYTSRQKPPAIFKTKLYIKIF